MDPILQTIPGFERLRHAFPHRLQYWADAGSALRGKPMRSTLRRPPLSSPGKSQRDLDHEKRNQEEELRLSFAKPGLTRVQLGAVTDNSYSSWYAGNSVRHRARVGRLEDDRLPRH